MTVLRNGLLVPERYSNRFSSNPFPLNGLQFYVDLRNVKQQGVGTLTNGTGVATPTSLVAGANTVTVTTEGTFTVWLPDGHTGTAASGTATVTGSPVSLSGNSNTITVVGTGTITVTCTDQVVDRSTNAALCTVTGATWGNQGRTFVGASGDGIEIPYTAPLNITGAITVLVRFNFITGSSGVLVGHDNLAGDRVYALSLGSNKVLVEQFAPYQSLAGDTTLNNATWAIIGYSDDLTNLRVWLNGVQDGSAAVASTKPSSTENLTIGRKLSAGANYTGTIDEAWIYNRAITAQENLQIYNATQWMDL